tara:strand:+ start:314 stop:655 length:342 start_codon:yes stop_codon:yes gene_type:complete
LNSTKSEREALIAAFYDQFLAPRVTEAGGSSLALRPDDSMTSYYTTETAWRRRPEDFKELPVADVAALAEELRSRWAGTPLAAASEEAAALAFALRRDELTSDDVSELVYVMY